MVASTIPQEGFNEERSSNLATTNARLLVYKFLPKYTGEIKMTYEVKAAAGNVQFMAVYGNRAAGTGYIEAHGALPSIIDYTVPIGTIYSAIAVGGSYGSAVLSTTSGATFTPATSGMTVFQLTPIYFVLSATSVPAVVGIQNFSINYEVR